MKKTTLFVLILALTLTLTACGKAAPAEKAPEPVDLAALRESIEPLYPPMMEAGSDMRLALLGIREEDCAQCVVLLCADVMKYDELWLLEAADDEALERLKGLAEQRMSARAQESESYAPAQFAVVQQGQVLTSGRYLALIVSPEVDQAAKLFQEAVG